MKEFGSVGGGGVVPASLDPPMNKGIVYMHVGRIEFNLLNASPSLFFVEIQTVQSGKNSENC